MSLRINRQAKPDENSKLTSPRIMKLSIVGSNELGTTVAQKLADTDWPGEILLVDAEPGSAEGKALDLIQANPILKTETRIRGSHKMMEVVDSNYVLIANMDGSFDEARKLFQVLGDLAGNAVVLLAINEPARLMAAARAAGIAPERIVATSPEALASTWRHHFARALSCSHQDVAASLLGAPPREGLYLVFASLAGQSLDRFLSPPQLRRIAAEVAPRSVPGPHNLATAAVDVLRNLLRKSGAVHSCYVWSRGRYGARSLFLCAPAILGPQGLQEVIEFSLDPAQRVTLDRGLDCLERIQRLSPDF
jgi:malate dehydrogenase